MPEPFQYQPAEYEAPSQGTYYAGENVEPYASRRIGPPSVPGQEFVESLRPAQEEMARTRLLKEMASTPEADAEASLAAATRFQGERLYRRLLNEGRSPGEALATAGPMLFGMPKSYTEAAAAERLSAPPKVQPPRLGAQDIPTDQFLKQQITDAVRRSQSSTALPEDRAEAARQAQNYLSQRQKLWANITPPTRTVTGPIQPGSAGGAGRGRTLKDARGRQWIYTGTMADPRQDNDPKNWQRVGA